MATNFFQRWSSRKLQAREENKDIEPVIETEESALQVVDNSADNEVIAHSDAVHRSEPTVDEASDCETETPALTLADVAAVSYESGVTDFMKKGVEKSVKKAALRKLFHSDEFNYVSDMDDHTEDFSNVPVLDSKVTAQLRNWVNEAVENVESMLEGEGKADTALAGGQGALASEIESGIAMPSDLSVYEAEQSANTLVQSDATEVASEHFSDEERATPTGKSA
ncbi:DUF3306 domain-containing protein [Photobacterium aquae]|uniref:DUF3306 domain-containing protein n=1 Tax=Photobacterium aquae TaxID=1195763 RepID=UPI00069FB33F|nr:DUF3306 domain-containing protein [Photobacterium aquae]